MLVLQFLVRALLFVITLFFCRVDEYKPVVCDLCIHITSFFKKNSHDMDPNFISYKNY